MTVPTPRGRASTLHPKKLRSTVGAFDAAVDEWFARNLRGRRAADRLFYTAANVADHSLIWHTVGAVNALRGGRAETAAMRTAIALGVESAIVNGLLKSLTRRERPVPDATRPLFLRIPVTTSFPSGHASSATLAAELLADAGVPRSLTWPAAAVVAASRVHVKIHHASDVIGGVATGFVLAALVRRFAPLR